MQLLVGLIFGVSFLLPPMQVQDAFPQEYLIRHYDIEDGLPVNSVNGMVQDDAGFLYISTYDGLVRYDGYEFKTYNSGNTPGMETNRIGGLIKSANNTIWLFNENGSISSKNGNVFRIYKSPEIPGTATRITEAKNGIIWISGTEGIAYFDEETAMFKILDEPLLKSYTDLLGTGLHGEVYAINDVGLVSYADNNPSLLLDIKDHPMLGLDIRQIKQFDNEFIWLVGSDIILRYALATGDTRYIEIPNERDVAFWNITPKEHGEFILTSTYGFYRLDAETLDLEKLTLSINANLARPDLVFEGADSEEIFIGDDEIVINGQEVINQVPSIKFGFLDREGSLWVGSLTDGLYQIRKSNFVNLAEPAFPGLVNIYSIIEDDKNSVWACGIAEGIVRISGAKSQNWNHTNSQLSSSFCKFLYQDSNGTIYAILNDRTIWTFNDERWSLVNDFDNTSDVKLETPEALHLSKNRFFFGNQNSLILSENGDFSYFDESQPEALSGIQVFTENSEGVIFAGTSGNGISRIEGDDYIQYSIKNESLTSNIIRDIFLQSDDTLWVATENLGLNRLVLDEKGNVLSSKSITTAEGLTHNSLHRIIEDPYRNLWISSNGGIMRIPKKALNDFADGTTTSFPILSFDEKDGMMNREANGGVQSAGILTNNNQLWFPNQRGITVIDPADFSEGQLIATPTSVFESIETENKLLYFDGKSRNTIPNHERDIRVNFTAPNFAYQDRVHFTYKMDGVNNTWQSADQSRQAVFTGLEPGEYTLEVRVEFIGGDPVETAAVIIIPSRFYETGWFATLMGLALVGLVAGVFKLRIRTLEEREQKLQQRVEEQTIELQKAAEQKSRFFTGITHELKTPLSLIVGPLEDMVEESGILNQELVKSRLVLMYRNSQRLKHLIDQILDVSKLNADALRLTFQPVNLAALTQQITGQFQSLLEQEKISLAFYSDSITEQTFVDMEAWERIIINLMTNAIKFSPKQSSIKIGIEDCDDALKIKVKDEGTGIAEEHQAKIFDYLYQVEGARAVEGTGIGLFLVKGLVQQMGGSVELKSEIGKGTEFSITLKKGYSHIEKMHAIIHDPVSRDNKIPSRHLLIENNSETEARTGAVNEHAAQILVVEDNVDFRSYLKSVLQRKYRVVSASEGNEALEMLKVETPDLIISDVMMPGMNGLAFVNSLRTKNHFKHLPVIFLSAKNHETEMQKGLSTGADIYLTKPIKSKMLLSQIDAVLRRERVLWSQNSTASEKEEPELIRQIREIVYRQMANPSLNINILADALFISRAKLYLEWKKVSDPTLNEFIKKLRFTEAKVLIKEKSFNVQEAARAVGFKDPNYFSTSFKKEFGISPSELHK